MTITDKLHSDLEFLCRSLPNRHVGSPGNRQATDFYAGKMRNLGFTVECPAFDCIDWEHGDVILSGKNERFNVFVGPYSPPCRTIAPLVSVSSVSELEAKNIRDCIVLVHGELGREQLMPKNFPFYNPAQHKKMYALLEHKQPAAIIAATGKNPQTAGAVYPFPLFEDGDFNIPSVYMTDKEGEKLLEHHPEKISLAFESRRIPARGVNVIARKGPPDAPKLVFCAHIDAKKGTPGALDDGTGIITLLALAEQLENYNGPFQLELIAFNGEDYYAAPGQILYLAQNADRLESIEWVTNIDGAGYHDGKTAFSFYQCPAQFEKSARTVFAEFDELQEGAPWFQGDHMIFVQKGRPALAVTTANFGPVWEKIAHTARDTPDKVDVQKLADLTFALRNMVFGFGQ